MNTRKRSNRRHVLLLSSFIFINYACNAQENNKNEKDRYSVVETTYGDCTIYKMIFKTGEFIFRFALSGKCETVDERIFKDNYKRFLRENKKSFTPNRRKIIIEYYEELKFTTKTMNDLIKITAEELNKSIEITAQQKDKLVLRVL